MPLEPRAPNRDPHCYASGLALPRREPSWPMAAKQRGEFLAILGLEQVCGEFETPSLKPTLARGFEKGPPIRNERFADLSDLPKHLRR